VTISTIGLIRLKVPKVPKVPKIIRILGFLGDSCVQAREKKCTRDPFVGVHGAALDLRAAFTVAEFSCFIDDGVGSMPSIVVRVVTYIRCYNSNTHRRLCK
jgi:hypothetical protein